MKNENNITKMTEREVICFSALLHDVGKFWQRAEWQRGYTGKKPKHQTLSRTFVDQLLEEELVDFIVANHHLSDLRKSNVSGIKRILAEIVCEADSLTSGEREFDFTNWGQKPYRCIANSVQSPFAFAINSIQPISSLTPRDYQFPTKTIPKEELYQDYINRWIEFEIESQFCDKHDYETLLHFYKKYLWCVPSAYYKAVPDVSLYEHSRLTVAVAICMYDYLCDKHKTLENIESEEDFVGVRTRDEKRYLLICGDITGIQNYIYNIAPKGAAKALKGRSFFLQQILDSIANSLLKGMQMPLTNLLYSSGGRFYILAPNTEQTLDVLRTISNSVEQKLFDEYNGELGIAIGEIALCASDFSIGEFHISQRWDELSKIIDRKKQSQFASLMKNGFFDPQGIGGSVISCAATGKDICIDDETVIKNLEGKELFSIESDSVDQKYICKEQKTAQLIGKDLRKAALMITGENIDKSYSILGLTDLSIFEEQEIPETFATKSNFRTYLFNDDNFIIKNEITQRGWKFYGGNWSIDEFDDIAIQGIGIHQMGVLRLDVDNLGYIFKEGLGEKATFSRIIQLSTMIDFFFSSYLNKLEDLKWDVVKGVCDDGETELGKVMQIVYSGGDDVFIVGVWHVLPDVALWIHDKFRDFTGENHNFSLSAGIALFPSRFPISKAASLAREAQDNAKQFKRKVEGIQVEKDAICFLGTTMSWNDFKKISILTKNIYEWVSRGKNDPDSPSGHLVTLDRSILHRLQMIHTEYKEGNSMHWAKWRWRACYTLSRFGDRNKAYSIEIKELSARLFLTANIEQDFISLLNVPATWAEYLTRKETHNDR